MTNSNVRASRTLIIPLLLVLVLVILSTIYLAYVRTPARVRYFTDSRLRALVILAEQIEGALQGRADAVFGATWRRRDWTGAVREVRDLKPVEPKRCLPREASAPQGGIYVELNSEPELGGANLRSTARTEWGVLPAGNVSVQRARAVLYFRADPPADEKPLRASVCAKSRLAQIVDPFIAGSEVNGFEVFVADAQGHVLFERGPVGLGLTRLPSAPESSAAADTGGAGTAPAAEAKAGMADGLPAIERLTRGSTVHEVPFGGTRYKLLAQPVRVPRVISSLKDAGRSPADSVWVVGMFVPVDVLEVEASTVSIGSWTHLPLLMVLILLTIPAVKIACMGPHEQLTARTVRALILCAVTGAGIAIVLMLGNLSYGWLEAELDSELELLSGQVQTHFKEEVQQAYDTVNLFRTKRGEPWARELRKSLERDPKTKTAATQCSGPPPEGWGKWRKTSCGLTNLLTQPTPHCPAYSDNSDNPNASVDLCEQAAAESNLCKPEAAESNLCEQAAAENNFCKRVAAESNLCEQVAVENNFCKRVAAKDDLCEQVAAENNFCEQVAAKDDLCERAAVENNFCKRAAAENNRPEWAAAKDDLCKQVAAKDDPCKRAAAKKSLREQAEEVKGKLKYPYFEMLILADQCGWQREKWTAKERITTLINIGEHNPFRDAMTGRLWSVPGDRKAVLHLQQSPNTALFVRTLTLPIWDTDQTHLLGVAVGVPELMSMAPVLPSGFGIAVIQGDGRVVFHSQERRNLYENFLTENTAFRQIEAAAAARRAIFLTSDYHGRTHRMYVHPLASSPWTLIVYRDMELPRTLYLDITGTWLLLFLLYVGGLAALWMLMRLFAGADDGEWIWPDPKRWCAYWSAVVVLAVVALASVLEIFWGPEEGPARLLVGTFAPLAALALTFLILAPPIEWDHAYDQRRHIRRRWRAAAWMGLAISGVGLALAALSSSDWVACVLFAFLVAASVGTLFSLIDGVRRFLWAANYAGATRLGKALQSRWEWGYAFVGLALLVVAGVLPSVAIYKDAFDLALSAFVRQEQRGLGLALAEREDRVRQHYNDKDGWPKDLWQDRIEEPWDLPPPGFFWVSSRPTGNSCPDACSNGSGYPWLIKILMRLTGHVCETKQQSEDFWRLAARHVSGLSMAWLPVYHRESGQLREFLFDRASDGRWCAEQNGMTLNDPRLTRGRVWLQGAKLPAWPVMPPPMPSVVILILMGLAVAAGYALIRWYMRRLFDIDQRIGTDGDGSGTWLAAQGLVLLHPTAGVRDKLDALGSACWIDMQESRNRWSTDDWRGLVVVDHLEYRLDDSDLNRAKLALLERLVLRQKLYVVVLSKIDPVQYFYDRLQSPGDEKADERYVTSEEIDRWAAVMERLMKVAIPLGGAPEVDEQRIVTWIERTLSAGTPGLQAHATLQEWEARAKAAFRTAAESRPGKWQGDASKTWQRALKEECRWTPRLRGMALDAVALLDPPDDPLHCVGDLALAHYRTVWSTLTVHQRLVLIHLARNDFANPNPRNWPVVRHLAEQGLILRTPALRLMNKTFARFVEQIETEEQVRKWERAAGTSTWSRIRSAFVVASILIAVFLFQTQPQLLTYISGGLVAAVGLATTVSNLLGFFQGRRELSPTPQESAPS